MKTITINKKAKIEAPAELKKNNIVALQVVEFVINYFGNTVVSEHDTVIMDSGRQYVIGGCGFIKEGFEV
jgi:hypothetical protein